MNNLRLLALLTLTLAPVAQAAQTGCVIKTGYVGGNPKMKLLPGMVPVCGAKRDQFLAGLKAAYKAKGQTMPKPKWFEIYVSDDNHPTVTPGIVPLIVGGGYVVSEDKYNPGKFGYMFSNYKNRATGEWLVEVMKEVDYASGTTYHAFIGY